MPMIEEFQKSGRFLFRWRSYLPLFFFVIIFAGLKGFAYPFGEHSYDLVWDIVCLAVGGLGIFVRVMTVSFVPRGTSGRGTTTPSASRLNTTGMYSVVRNPIYLGNFLTFAAPVLFFRASWVLLVFAPAFALYYERIIFAEESFLREKFGQEYLDWASKTPAFFPRFSGWVRPDLPFSWKTALTREYHGVYGLVATLFALEVLGDFYLNHSIVIDRFWLAIFSVATVFYLTVRFLVRRTTLLKVENR